MLPWVCSVIDHRRRQNVVRTLVTHSAIASCATFLFLPHFDVICDLLLNRRTATWNLFVKQIISPFCKLSDGGVCPADFLFGLSYILRGHYDQLSPLLALVCHCLLYFVVRVFWKPYHVFIILTQLISQPSTLLCSIPRPNPCKINVKIHALHVAK